MASASGGSSICQPPAPRRRSRYTRAARSRAADQKFPQSILPRTFNYGFATGLMLKDVRLAVAEAKELGVPNEVISKVLDAWETTNTEYGGDSDFTSIVKMIERRAGGTAGKGE